MMGSRVWLVAAAAVAAFTAGVANAQDLKIGVVNLNRLIEQAPQAEAVQKALNDEFGPRQRDITAAEQRLRTQQETFQRDAPVMGETERLNLERQIRDGQRDLQRQQNEFLEDFNLRRNEELGKLSREVIQKAQEYARAQQFDLLLEGSNIVFASTAVDVTEAVLAALKPAGGGGGQ
jgi:outer membrane protein